MADLARRRPVPAGVAWVRRRLGVRLRSALAAAIVVALALGLGAAIFIYIARLALIGNVDDTARQRAGDVAAAVAAGDRDQIAQTLRTSPGEQTVVQVLAPSGAVEATSPALAGAPPLSPLRPPAGQTRREQRTLAIDPEDSFRIAAVGVQSTGGTRTVLVGQSLKPVNESSEVVTAVLATGMPILMLIVGVATFWFVGRSLRPVEDIRRQVARITARELYARVPVPAAHDEVAALAATMNEMLDRLDSAASSQRQFVADASHELRSPLATIQAGLERLATVALPEQAGHHVRLMRAETQRLGRLVGDLLLLARIDERGGRSARHEDVDLDDLAYTERERLTTQHPRLRVPASITPVRITGDAHDLGRALRNLTDNAARHARGEVRLRVWTDGRDGYLDVSDDGPGVPAQERERIFERFVRLDDSRSRADGGSGLGLPITREIVTALGGTVTALPGDPATGGLTIRIRLPLAATEPNRRAR